jgi:hypothetical protein
VIEHGDGGLSSRVGLVGSSQRREHVVRNTLRLLWEQDGQRSEVAKGSRSVAAKMQRPKFRRGTNSPWLTVRDSARKNRWSNASGLTSSAQG